MPNFTLTAVALDRRIVASPLHLHSAAVAVPALVPARERVAATPEPPVRRNLILDAGTRRVQPELIRTLDPKLWGQISTHWPRPGNGQTRETLELPVSPSGELTDTLVFEGATDGKRYYLPRYRLAVQKVSGNDEYALHLDNSASAGWTLQLVLEPFRAPEIDVAIEASPLAHELLLRLIYPVSVGAQGSTRKELAFQEISHPDETGRLSARLRFASVAERDQAMARIIDLDGAANLLLTRAIHVAIPMGAAPSPRPKRLRHQAGMPGRQALTAAQLHTMTLAGDTRIPMPAAVTTPLYRPVQRGLDTTVEPQPFYVNPAFHHQIAGSIATAGGRKPGLIAHQVELAGQRASYWQDAADPARFYYLPHEFRLARHPSPPFDPLVAVKVDPGTTDSADRVAMTLEFTVMPHIDDARLQAARAPLATVGATAAGLAPAQLAAALRFEPLPVAVADAHFFLALPRAGMGSAQLTERKDVAVNMLTGGFCSETLALPAFRAVYDALFGGEIALMHGEVRVDLGDGLDHSVPFVSRFDQILGDVAEIRFQREAGDTVLASVTNLTESAVVLTHSAAAFVAEGVRAPAILDGLDVHGGLALEPQQNVVLRMTPVQALTPGTSFVPELRFTDIVTRPTPEKVWERVLDQSVPAEFLRLVRVRAASAMFESRSGKPEDRVLAIVVEFDGGDAVELTPEALQAEVQIAQPIVDLVLRRSTNPGYRYRCRLVHPGRQQVDAKWREDSIDLLFPLLPGDA